MQELIWKAQSLIIVFSVQEKVETKGCCSKKRKAKRRITVVPLEGNRIQTSSTRSKQINPGKEEGIPIQRTRERKGQRREL